MILTNLAAACTLSDQAATIIPDLTGIVDWSQPVQFTVIGSGGTTMTYTVTARVVLPIDRGVGFTPHGAQDSEPVFEGEAHACPVRNQG